MSVCRRTTNLPALIALALCSVLSLTRAGATYRADFFDIKKKPTVSLNKKTMTWTLRNQAVERVVQFDPKSGSLRTLSLKNLQSGHTLTPMPGSEGAISFSASIVDTPFPLTDWKYTRTEPIGGNAWTFADFPESGWIRSTSLLHLPVSYITGGPLDSVNTSHSDIFLRTPLPAYRMRPNHAYALILDCSGTVDQRSSDVSVYFDGALAQKAHVNELRLDRYLQVDVVPGSRSLAIRAPFGAVHSVSLVEVGSAPPPLDLTHDWKYMFDTINTGQDNSQILTISLSGINSHEGFDLSVSYQIYADTEPTLAKWFTFVNNRASTFQMEQVQYDRWALVDFVKQSADPDPHRPLCAADPKTGDGIMTAVLAPFGGSLMGANGNVVTTVASPHYVLKPQSPQRTPVSLCAFYRGHVETGKFLYQLYVGQYVTRAKPTDFPTTYNTRYGYGTGISANICRKIVPSAAAIGVKLFLIDDGWQSNSLANTGSYGDWNMDRQPTKFPLGLGSTSLLIRENKMRFGLWVDPVSVDPRSRAAKQHKDWLNVILAESGTKAETDTMGFTSQWASQFTMSMKSLSHDLNLTALKINDGGRLFQDGDVSVYHEHPLFYSVPATLDAWKQFTDDLHTVTPEFLLDRRGNPLIQETDTIDVNSLPAEFPAAEDARSSQAWLAAANHTRAHLVDAAELIAPYALSAPAPCHIPLSGGDTNLTDFYYASVVGCTGNLEIQGRLEDTTIPEQQLAMKWITWSEANRPWLAYSQSLPGLSPSPGNSGSASRIQGVLHLRPLLENRYGYLFLWNGSSTADNANITFNPADYYLRLKTDKLQIVRVRDGAPVPFTIREGAISLGNVALPAVSWEAYEIRVIK